MRESILIVDDEPRIRELMLEILESDGFRVVACESGPRALERLRRDSFQLILTDLMMPGMDGLTLVRKARALDPTLAAVILTGHASTDSAVSALRSGVDDYLVKPFEVDELREVIRRTFERQRERLASEELLAMLGAARPADESASTTLHDRIRCAQAELQAAESKLHRRTRELEVLREITRTGAYGYDLDGWLEHSLEAICRGLDVAHGRIFLEDEGRLRVRVRFGAESASSAHEFVSVPLRAGNKSIGLLHLAGRNGAGGFPSGVAEALAAMAGGIAAAIENHRLVKCVRETQLQATYALVQGMEAKDSYLRGHSDRVTRYALDTARAIGLPAESQAVLRYAGQLHDVGKIGVPEAILHKPGKLEPEEFETLKTHVEIGAQIVKHLDFLGEARPVIRHHHERWDGKGYPAGLAGGEIPFLATIIAVADSYDAMTSDRRYRRAMNRDQAASELRRGAGSQWSPAIVDAFLRTSIVSPTAVPLEVA
ncbi:MAG: response regulator [Planctomycetes bacterium]|nr:response regulator [Planctomycetota bacterium]